MVNAFINKCSTVEMQSMIYTQAPVCQKHLFQMHEFLESLGRIHPRRGLKHGGVGQLVLQF